MDMSYFFFLIYGVELLTNSQLFNCSVHRAYQSELGEFVSPGIDSKESSPGLLKRLQIRALYRWIRCIFQLRSAEAHTEPDIKVINGESFNSIMTRSKIYCINLTVVKLLFPVFLNYLII